MKIALDVLGGDNALNSNILGAIEYLKDYGKEAAEIILVGNEIQIENEIEKISYSSSKITIVDAKDVVSMNERSSRIFREKPNSSLVKSIQLVKDGQAHAALSAGNTGALLSSSLFLIGKIPGITRPAFAPYIPSNNGGFILCDAGANADSKPQHLLEFAIMAEAYITHLINCKNPRIALLNIGIEENKGNDLTKSTYDLLKKYVNNFIGNIESRYIMEGNADVIICDGFTGNIVLKLTEGVISHLISWQKHELKKMNFNSYDSIFNDIFSNITKTLDHEEYGATPFLGINGVVMKCHGSSTSRGIKNSLKAAQATVESNLIQNISNKIKQYSNSLDNNTIISETHST